MRIQLLDFARQCQYLGIHAFGTNRKQHMNITGTKKYAVQNVGFSYSKHGRIE